MTGFLFIRHTVHDLIATRIAGRMAGVHLNNAGREAAETLAQQLVGLPIAQIFSGPLERARETAEPLSRRLGIPLQIAREFDEVEIGDWTGRTFTELDAMPEWKNWNSFRSNYTPPGGESMLEVQLRVVQKLAQLKDHGLVAIFSHGDVIRSLVAYYLGVPIDLFLRIEIDPGSVTLLVMYDESVVVRCVNATGPAAAERAGDLINCSKASPGSINSACAPNASKPSLPITTGIR